MSLEAFLHDLHFDTDKARPPDWEVDWDDAPLPYKLYRGLPAFSLSQEVPLTLQRPEQSAKPDLRELSHFLWYVFGLTQVSQTAFPMDAMEEVSLMQSYRRFVPSGGALYPNELYIYLKIDELPCGVYHYDVAHHRLVLLREGNFDEYLARVLGNRCEMSACFGTAFVSTMFWKNFYKYSNFSYRLQGLDAGVLIGQLCEVAKRFDFESGVYFQFLDRAVNYLLGLSEQEESVYAVIPLSLEPRSTWFGNGTGAGQVIAATELIRELAEIRPNYLQRSRRVKGFPTLIAFNEASLMDSIKRPYQIQGKKGVDFAGETIMLPRAKPLAYDLASVCRTRFSPGMDFVSGKVGLNQLSTLLQEATDSFPYPNDLDTTSEKPRSRVSLYVCLNNVEGISDGAYEYDCGTHAIRQWHSGDHRLQLQYAMSADNVNLNQVPLCFHIAGDRDHLITALGYRGYRIQQMEAGMLVQRLLLAASAVRMAGHPLLGFDVSMCDQIYNMDSQGKTSLIQIPVGPYREPSRLAGSLYS